MIIYFYDFKSLLCANSFKFLFPVQRPILNSRQVHPIYYLMIPSKCPETDFLITVFSLTIFSLLSLPYLRCSNSSVLSLPLHSLRLSWLSSLAFVYIKNREIWRTQPSKSIPDPTHHRFCVLKFWVYHPCFPGLLKSVLTYPCPPQTYF